ncbi:uncharacterized protein [Maniola hyperantus]|uniref:uncharacterized protein n=1 Tax=Aphantopus hyperantus TaxID=2795564 RepID=UPI003747E190
MDSDKAKKVISQIWNITEELDSEKYQYYYEFVELIGEISFRGNLQNFWKYQGDDTVNNIDLLQLAISVHPNFPLKIATSQSKEVQWMPVMTEEGLCQTFNSEYAKYQIVDDRAWRNQELMKCHYHSEACFVRINTMENGVRYFIHSPFDIATAISNPTGEVRPDEELVTDFKVVEIEAANRIKSLRSEQRRCRYPDEWLGSSIKMAMCATRTAWRVSEGTWRYWSICQRTSPTAPVCPNAKSSIIIHTQKRSLFVLPLGLDVALVGVAAYYITRLKKPDQQNVESIFGPVPGSKESSLYPDKIVKCIAHRGAGLDAPENTLEAFKYCVENECNFVELDVRTSKDGQLVLLHDAGLQRLSGVSTDIRDADWDSVRCIDVGATHPNRHLYKEVHLCLLSEALEYLLPRNVKIIIDVKGDDKQVVNGILKTFSSNPALYKQAVVTTFNPFTLYQIRYKDPQIVGAISYRPYCFSAQNYDAENGPSNPRFGDKLATHGVLRAADLVHSLLWRWSARWCSVSAVLLHKDIVSPSEVSYWRSLDVRCAGWCVNRPLEKLYWRAVLKAPYLANTLLGEPEEKREQDKRSDVFDRPGQIVDRLLETEKRMTSGQN